MSEVFSKLSKLIREGFQRDDLMKKSWPEFLVLEKKFGHHKIISAYWITGNIWMYPVDLNKEY